MSKILIYLPFPPSVNEMFANNNRAGRGRILSTFYRAWKEEAGWMLKAQKIKPYIGRFRLGIQLDDSHRGDCDNRVKAVSDLLVSNGIVQGDQKKYMKGVSVDWERVTDCVVYINEVF